MKRDIFAFGLAALLLVSLSHSCVKIGEIMIRRHDAVLSEECPQTCDQMCKGLEQGCACVPIEDLEDG